MLSYQSPKGNRAGRGAGSQQKGVFSNDQEKSHRYGSRGHCRCCIMALVLVSMATGQFYGLTVVLAFLMPVLAFVELDLLCNLF